MIVEPYVVRPAPPDLALLAGDGRFTDEDGRHHLAARLPKGVQAWAAEERVLALLREGKGRALCWRGRPIRYAPSGVQDYRVRILGLPFPADDEDALQGLGVWRDWLAEYGAAPGGSLGATSMSLLRATLADPLWTSMPFASAPPLRFTIGGRQEVGPAGVPAEYTGDLGLFDMRAAYASTLAGLWYGGHWFRLHLGRAEQHARMAASRDGSLVFCRARVRLAGSRPGPLVRRPRKEPVGQLGFFAEYPTEGTISGVWTWAEIEAAREHGAQVKILDGWVHMSPVQPFQPWWRAVQHGRRLHGFAGLLGKATGNALWGQFCISSHGVRQLLYYTAGGRRVVRELPSRGGRRPAHDLAEFLTGTVRAALYGFVAAAGDRLCSAHTDGGWVDKTGGWSYPDWRLKEEATRLRVLDPQVLAYRRVGADQDSYVVSGWPADGAADLFESQCAERIPIAV